MRLVLTQFNLRFNDQSTQSPLLHFPPGAPPLLQNSKKTPFVPIWGGAHQDYEKNRIEGPQGKPLVGCHHQQALKGVGPLLGEQEPPCLLLLLDG